ncbi:MAG: beta-ketoacyl-ACP synthase II [Candidatus Omnitrophica bacterium]|jgi:3-oxoacyl-[acyl-carrier-protein] synthase II|nr:beta-ketoacyl-ACP synthase II [Candidatus Omnitrophota bacterium]MDD5078677.1 beta-ketoacyl-ACP synthase II [Candidatus Omnitrophota bacterium]
MKKRVVITGLGTITPVGNDVSSFWQSLKEGKSGVGPITYFDTTGFDSKIAAQVKDFDPAVFGISHKEARRTAQFVQFSIAAAKQAMESSGLQMDNEDRTRMGVLIGSGIGSLHTIEEEHKVLLNKGPSRLSPFLIPMLIVNEASGMVAIVHGLKGPNSCVATACASGSHAIGEAYRTILYGDADIMLTGGTESCIVPTAVGGFCALRALSTRNDDPKKASRPFDGQRDGFVMAEGCGLVVLEELEHALSRNAEIIAEIKGFGMSCDAYHITAPDPEGAGAAQAMSGALKDAGMNPEEISYINAHGTSTKMNDKIETLSMKKTFGEYSKKVMISSTKSVTGHLLGAAGGVEFVACCLAIKDGVIPPTINYENPDPDCDLDYVPNTARKINVEACMSNSLGFGGHNASLIVKKFKK